jgi:hypothetical protein
MVTVAPAAPTYATDIKDVWPAALDLPRVYAAFEYNGTVLSIDPNDPEAFIPAWCFLDTGASGVLVSSQTRDLLQMPQAFAPDGVTPVEFGDVGVGGQQLFDVSETLTVRIAPQHPSVDPYVFDGNYEAFNSVTPNVRTHMGTPIITEPPNPIDILLSTLDVIGMPAMRGKVMVMDPRPTDKVIALITDPNADLDDLDIFIHTSLHDANNAAAPIPQTSRTVKLSYASFDSFTTTTPAGSQGPTLARNPFVGPSPFPNADGQFNDAPPVKLKFGSNEATASLLLDTGGSVSALSQAIAAQLGVTYDPANPIGSDAPKLLGVPADEQIVTTLAGVGGEVKVAGFFLSSLLLRAQEGNLLDDLDEAHLRFLDAPVYIFDIKLSDTLTLDGILGMNFLSASTFVEGDGLDFAFLAGRESPFSAVVFNEANGTLGLEPVLVPEPTGATLALGAIAGLVMRRRRRA